MTPRRSSTYHEPKACSQCFRAKTKCLPGADSKTGGCLRCTRLGKICTPRIVSPRLDSPRLPHARQTLNTATVNSQLSTLENKTDFLATGLDLHARLQAPAIDGLINHAPADSSSVSFLQSLAKDLTLTVWAGKHKLPDFGCLERSTLYADQQTQTQLANYLEHQAKLFPFVVIPSDSVQELAQRCPLLLRAILMAGSFHDRTRQIQLGAALTRDLSHLAFVVGEKSFDMFQSLLVHISFYHVHHRVQSQMSNLVQLAIALMSDLGLDKPSHDNDRRKLIFDNARTSYGFDSSTQENTTGHLDTRRSVLGCFYLSSLASVIFQRTQSLRFSHYMDSSCRMLLESSLDSDLYAVRLVEQQVLMERMTKDIRLDEAFIVNTRNAWRDHIDELRASLASLEDRRFEADPILTLSLDMHRTVASMYLHEVALFDRAWDRATESGSDRLNFAHTCLRSAASFLSLFLGMPDENLYTMPYSVWAQLAYTLLMSSRLSLLQLRGWLVSEIESVLNFSDVLDDVYTKFSRASRLRKLDTTMPHGDLDRQTNGSDTTNIHDDEILSRTANKVTRIKTWYLAYTDSRRAVNIDNVPTPGQDVGFKASERGFLASQSDISLDWFTAESNDNFWAELVGSLDHPPT